MNPGDYSILPARYRTPSQQQQAAPQAALLMVAASSGPADPNFSTVVVLMHYDGVADGSTTFTNTVEPLGRGTTFTRFGSTSTVSTTAPLYGSGSLAPNGSGGCNATAWSPQYQPSFSGGFTLEASIITSSPGATQGIVDLRRGPPYGDGWALYARSGTFAFYGSNVSDFIVGGTVATNTRQQVAVTYQSGADITRLFVDGTIVATVAGYPDGGGNNVGCFVGCLSDATSYYMRGQVDEVRFTNPGCRYTANYTPATVPFPDY